MKKVLLVLITVCLLFQLTGCATVFGGNSKKVTINSNPSGASVKIDGVNRGQTPLVVDLDKKNSYTVEVSKEGYNTKIATIEKKFGVGWLVLDIFTGLVPVIVDAATGSWNVLSPTEINVEL